MKIFKNSIIFSFLLLCACFLSINSQTVEIRLFPDGLKIIDVVVHLPLFIIILIFTGTGLFIGTIFEYLRASKERQLVQKDLIQAKRLSIETKHVRSSTKSETDEILSLLK